MNRGQLAIVHIAKAQVGLDESDYRDLLYSAAGVESSRDLTQAGFRNVMKVFESLGFESQRQKGRVPGGASVRQIEAIRTTWEAITGHPRKSSDFKATLWTFLGRFVDTPGDVFDRLNSLTEPRARHIIAVMNNIVNQKEKTRHERSNRTKSESSPVYL